MVWNIYLSVVAWWWKIKTRPLGLYFANFNDSLILCVIWCKRIYYYLFILLHIFCHFYYNFMVNKILCCGHVGWLLAVTGYRVSSFIVLNRNHGQKTTRPLKMPTPDKRPPRWFFSGEILSHLTMCFYFIVLDSGWKNDFVCCCKITLNFL